MAAHAYGSTVAVAVAVARRLAGRRLAAAHAIRYPAVTAPHWLGPLGLPTGLDRSEQAGARRLTAAIRTATRGRCATRPVLLVGYSQGAEVVARAVRALPPARRGHVSVALLGDPSFVPDLPQDVPAGARLEGIRPALLGAGITVPRDLRDRTLDLCAGGDPICGLARPGHAPTTTLSQVLAELHVHDDAYLHRGLARQAGRFLARRAN